MRTGTGTGRRRLSSKRKVCFARSLSVAHPDSNHNHRFLSVKDLSHVPCKFFKVGACTAGSSCPFSHNVPEPGGHKEVCAWFVKGNCKFGHKCALAHILPGQSMTMDRKNKKAAQVAANNASGGKDGGKGGKGQRKDVKPGGGFEGSSSSPARHTNPLLSGSTAPTRVLPPSSRPPLPVPLKASISPSAPAPPLQDTDFPSFGLPEEDEKPPVVEAKTQPRLDPLPTSSTATSEANKAGTAAENTSQPTSSPLPLSTPSAPRRLAANVQGSPAPLDFGPIGSPPRTMASTGKPARINGGSPGTSPSFQAGFTSTSPFSAPGAQTVFDTSTDIKARSGIAASLGANRAWMTDFTPIPAQSISRTNINIGTDLAVDDEDFEDFLPSSLTDLLTVEERSRRMSRSNSGQRGVTITRDPSGQRSAMDGPHHRYSRSVPAPSLLSDIQSIWSDTGPSIPVSPEMNASNPSLTFTVPAGRFASGTPSSFKSNNTFGGRSFTDDTFPPAVPPSNASAAFLPGLHHHYLSAKAASQQHPAVGRNTATTSNLVPTTRSTNLFTTVGSTGMTLSPPPVKTMTNRTPLDSVTADSIQSQTSSTIGRPIPGNTGMYTGDTDERRNALSPSTRALQTHAPGQSLPQGLAAGYSRIHALPPPPMIPSPSATSTFNLTPKQSIYSPSTNGHDWSSGLDFASAGVVTGAAPGVSNLSLF